MHCSKKQLNRHVQTGLSLCIKVHNGGGLAAAPGELLRLLGQLDKKARTPRQPSYCRHCTPGTDSDERGDKETSVWRWRLVCGRGPTETHQSLTSISKTTNQEPLIQPWHKYQTLLSVGNGRHSVWPIRQEKWCYFEIRSWCGWRRRKTSSHVLGTCMGLKSAGDDWAKI